MVLGESIERSRIQAGEQVGSERVVKMVRTWLETLLSRLVKKPQLVYLE